MVMHWHKNDEKTYIWYDAWHSDDAVADRFPALHRAQSQQEKEESCLVAQVMDESMQHRSCNLLRYLVSSNRDRRRGPFLSAAGKD